MIHVFRDFELDPERGAGERQSRGDLVHGAIASPGDAQRHAASNCRLRELACVSGAIGEEDVPVYAATVQKRRGKFGPLPRHIRPSPGASFTLNVTATDGGSLNDSVSIPWTMPGQAHNHLFISPPVLYMTADSSSQPIELSMSNVGNASGSFPITPTLPVAGWSIANLQSPIPMKDLHEFIRHLERTGQLLRVTTPVSRDLEIAAIADRVMKGPKERNKAGATAEAAPWGRRCPNGPARPQPPRPPRPAP